MHQLIIAATSFELGDLRSNQTLVTGVGIHSTVYHLTGYLLKNPPSQVLQIGIAGSFDRELPLGSIVEVTQDCFADLGIDNHGNIEPAWQSGLIDGDEHPFTSGWLVNDLRLDNALMPVRGITVNLASGSQSRIDELNRLYQPSIESMEGAAAAYVCKMMHIPFYQVRAISNYVTVRNVKEWRMREAVAELHKWLGDRPGR